MCLLKTSALWLSCSLSLFLQQIQNIYEQDPTLYADDIDVMYKLRESAMEAVTSNTCSAEGCMALKRYYVHLVRLTEKFPRLLEQKRFPETHFVNYKYEEGGPLPPVMFSWWVCYNFFIIINNFVCNHCILIIFLYVIIILFYGFCTYT